jgi:hypothetical protein
MALGPAPSNIFRMPEMLMLSTFLLKWTAIVILTLPIVSIPSLASRIKIAFGFGIRQELRAAENI